MFTRRLFRRVNFILAAALLKAKSWFTRPSPQPADVGPAHVAATASDAGVIHCPVCGQANRVRGDTQGEAARCGRCKGSLTGK